MALIYEYFLERDRFWRTTLRCRCYKYTFTNFSTPFQRVWAGCETEHAINYSRHHRWCWIHITIRVYFPRLEKKKIFRYLISMTEWIIETTTAISFLFYNDVIWRFQIHSVINDDCSFFTILFASHLNVSQWNFQTKVGAEDRYRA